MKTLTLDFETAYSAEYSLSKMSPIEYILDARYECQGLAVKRGKDAAFWVEGDEVAEFFDDEPEDVLCVSHNALFDMAICCYRYGWVPKLMLDTLGVSRAVLQSQLKSLSLDSVARHLGLGVKGTNLSNVKGLSLSQIRANGPLHMAHIAYGINDVDLCYGIFDKLVLQGGFPASEIVIMDSVLRCAVEPQFIIDRAMLAASLEDIKAEKERMLATAMLLGIDTGGDLKSQLMSNEKFAAILRKLGVEPPMKTSPVTGRTNYAFAKSDVAFLDLLEHDDPVVQAVVAARFGHKSTIEESRHERFINIANLEWPITKRNFESYPAKMPMPLRYGGAHTHRLSGDWKLNVQNMGRKSKLRKALKAPPGYVVVAGDESQVEARMTATLAGEEELRQAFEDGEDVYSLFATDLFGRPIDKYIDIVERFIGKQCILGLGFNLGWLKFMKSIPILSQNQIGKRITISEEEAKKTVATYRSKYSNITASWKFLNTTGISALFGTGDVMFGPCRITKGEVILPNGLKLYYENIRRVETVDDDGRVGYEVMFDYGGKPQRLYGGKFLENIVQALARLVVMDAVVRIRKRLAKAGIQLALQVHDELVFVVPERLAQVVKGIMNEELSRRPEWLPNLPLACEIGIGPTYGEAK